MGRLYDAYVEVGPRFTGMGDIKNQGDKAGKEYGKALAEAAVKAAKANARNLGAALAKARSAEADAAGKVRVAETQLAEARKKYGAASSQAISAEERLAAAQRKSASAADTTKHATEALGKAQSQVTSAAADAGKRSGGRFTGAFKGALSKIGGEKEGRQVATRFGVGMNGAIGGVVSRSAGVFVAGFAAIKSAQVFGTFINDARESAKVARVSAQVIRSTGGAAKITAAQMGDLAASISNKTGADDEDIQSGENLLATFTNVRNEVGKNNDIFNRASQAAVDMASAMNNGVVDANGLKAANIQLGKALNDPVKGVTALSKVGVSFTAKQKEQIKTLVDSGKTLEAQKIILGEVGKEFGGAAAAAADPMSRLKTIAGNLSESVGGLLLPTFDKFVKLVSDVAIPGIYALGAAFQGEGVTSSGFVGVMERIGVAARAAFGFFRSEVLPRLKEFGGFIIGTAVPAVSGFVSNLVTSLAPAVKDVFGFFRTEVLPRLKDFAGFLGDKVLPKVGELATALSKNKDFLVPFAATIVTIIAAMKAWAIVQGILNVVMSANPIGLVVIAIAALVAGIVWAYKNSETFRKILTGAFDGIRKAAQTFAPLVKAAIGVVIAVFQLWWTYYAKPILTLFWKALQFAWGQAQKFGKIVAAGFQAIREPARAALAFVVDQFLGFIEFILNGAAKAFGWVPKLGPKLKAAATEFGKFRDSVNAKLAGIKDQTITVTAKLNSANIKNKNLDDPRLRGSYATGGRVFGAGTGTSDSIPAMLSNGEHVWTAKEVQKAGGHGEVEKMRKSVRGYASGGAVQFKVKPQHSSTSKFAKEVAAHSVALVRPAAQALANQMFDAPGGPPGSVRSYRGVRLNSRTIQMLNNAERILGAAFHITQGSYSRRVAASGSTHAGGGAMDTNGPRGWNTAVAALRRAGFAAWHRTPAQGPWNHHIHSIAIGDSSASPAAKAQVRSFLRGGNGLGGMAKGGPVTKSMAGNLGIDTFDTGGRWRSGTIAANTSGKTETVIPGDGAIELSHRSIERLADALSRRPVMLNGDRVDQAISRRALSY